VALVRAILLGELAPEQVCSEQRLSTAELTEWIRVHRRAARRAIDEQIAAALAAQGLEKDDFVLSGNLESMALSDLLEAIQFGRKNAHIRIEHGGEHSHLWCSDGDVIDAQAGSLSGTRAVYRLLSLRKGRLQADFSSVQRERTVVTPTDALLLDFARRLDECKLLREQIGDQSRICLPNASTVAGPALEAEHAEVLRAFNGTRSIAEVLEAIDRPEFETLASLARLLAERRLVAISALEPAEVSLPISTSISSTIEQLAAAPPSVRLSEISVPPIAPSVTGTFTAWSTLERPTLRLARRYAPYAAAVLALPLAFALGFASVRPFEPKGEPAPGASPSWTATLAPALCGPGMAFLPGGAAPPDSALGASETIRPFCLAQRAVSTEEYQSCVASQRCEPPETASPGAANVDPDPRAPRCNAEQSDRQHHAINCVTHQQAEQYCEWRGQRLPLAVEWEFAWQASHAASSGGPSELARRGPGSSFGEVSEWTKSGGARLPPSAEPLSYVVLAPASEGPATGGARPSRLFMSASARGKNLGFRCALSLAASAALPTTGSVPRDVGRLKP
jgi:formylglycine-generating enzyme required for sulfatase activity